MPSYLGRTEVACGRPNQKCIIKKKPSEYMRSQSLADTMVLTEDGLILTNIPFGWPVNVDYVINDKTLTPAEKEQILGGNLMKLLRITS